MKQFLNKKLIVLSLFASAFLAPTFVEAVCDVRALQFACANFRADTGHPEFDFTCGQFAECLLDNSVAIDWSQGPQYFFHMGYVVELDLSECYGYQWLQDCALIGSGSGSGS